MRIISINAVTNCLISYMLLDSYLNDLLIMLNFIEYIISSYWLVFCLRPQGGTAMKNWAYLASELTQKFSFSYRYTGKMLGCY